MILGEILDAMDNSKSLIIKDAAGKELYRGYVGMFQYSELPLSSRVKHIGLAIEHFKRVPPAKIPASHRERVIDTERYSYYDMDLWIYYEVVVV